VVLAVGDPHEVKKIDADIRIATIRYALLIRFTSLEMLLVEHIGPPPHPKAAVRSILVT